MEPLASLNENIASNYGEIGTARHTTAVEQPAALARWLKPHLTILRPQGWLKTVEVHPRVSPCEDLNLHRKKNPQFLPAMT